VRVLLHVPIIHVETDLGTAGAAVRQQGAALTGERKWARHRQVVDSFWRSLSAHFDSAEAAGLKIYQDGLVADGELGLQIVREAAEQGSPNHQIMLHLTERGAQLVKTESRSLMMEEYSYVRRFADAQGISSEPGARSLHSRRASLIRERDQFIALTIDETLGAGETGVLFIGSLHDIARYIPKDISVRPLVDRDKLNAYIAELAQGEDWTRFEQLAAYVASPL